MTKTGFAYQRITGETLLKYHNPDWRLFRVRFTNEVFFSSSLLDNKPVVTALFWCCRQFIFKTVSECDVNPKNKRSPDFPIVTATNRKKTNMFSKLLIPAFWEKELRQNKAKSKTENIYIYGETVLSNILQGSYNWEFGRLRSNRATKCGVVGYIFHIAFHNWVVKFFTKHISQLVHDPVLKTTLLSSISFPLSRV